MRLVSKILKYYISLKLIPKTKTTVNTQALSTSAYSYGSNFEFGKCLKFESSLFSYRPTFVRNNRSDVFNAKTGVINRTPNELFNVRNESTKRTIEVNNKTLDKKSPRARSKKITSDSTNSQKKTRNVKNAVQEFLPSSIPESETSVTAKKLSNRCLLPLFPFEGTEQDTAVSCSSLEDENAFKYTVKRMDLSDGRFYLITSLNESFCFPSVTTVLDATKPKAMFYSLQTWRKNMIKEHGRAEFKKISANTLQSGTSFHKQVESRLLAGADRDVISIKPWKLILEKDQSKSAGMRVSTSTTTTDNLQSRIVWKPSAPPDGVHTVEQGLAERVASDSNTSSPHEVISGYMKSVEHILKDIGSVYALESVVTHIDLGYTGTFDCLAEYKGELVVIDWKTSHKPRPNLVDCFFFPLQAAAYAGAINQDRHYPFKVKSAMIVVAYPNGDPAHTHLLSYDMISTYWEEWIERLEEYQTQFSCDLSELTV